jgi:hypothetical protein
MKRLIYISLLPLVFFSFIASSGLEPQKEVAPVPNAAFGPAVPQDRGYLVEEIRDGLYWVTEGAYQVIFLTTGQG